MMDDDEDEDEDEDDEDEDEDEDEGEDEDSETEPAHPPAMKSTGVLLKRPGSLGFKYVIPKVTTHILKSTTWPIFGSKVYHESKRGAKTAGCSPEDAANTGRYHYKEAGEKRVAAGGSKTQAKPEKSAKAAKGAKGGKRSKVGKGAKPAKDAKPARKAKKA